MINDQIRHGNTNISNNHSRDIKITYSQIIHNLEIEAPINIIGHL